MEMTKVRNMFYKPEWFDGNSLDNGIDIYTRHANFWVNPAKLNMGIIERWKLLGKLSCSHAEMWFPDENGCFEEVIKVEPSIRSEVSGGYITTTFISQHEKTVYRGQMFTSTMRMNAANGNTDGIVMRPASDVLKHPGRWRYSEFEVPKAAVDSSMAWCREMVANNKGYDKKDIAKFFTLNGKKRIQDVNDGKLICSGATWAAMWKIWEWCLENKVPVYNDFFGWFNLLIRLFGERSINLIMSPILLAIWQYQAKCHFYECSDGSLII